MLELVVPVFPPRNPNESSGVWLDENLKQTRTSVWEQCIRELTTGKHESRNVQKIGNKLLKHWRNRTKRRCWQPKDKKGIHFVSLDDKTHWPGNSLCLVSATCVWHDMSLGSTTVDPDQMTVNWKEYFEFWTVGQTKRAVWRLPCGRGDFLIEKIRTQFSVSLKGNNLVLPLSWWKCGPGHEKSPTPVQCRLLSLYRSSKN